MSEDIAYRMCSLEMREDKQLRKEVAEHLINDLMLDRNGASVDKASLGGKRVLRDGVDEVAQSYYGILQLTATAHCANDVRMDASQVQYVYDDAGHFLYMAGSENNRR